MKTKADFEYIKYHWDCLKTLAADIKKTDAKFDGNTLILERQLTHLLARAKMKIYPALKAFQLFPVNSEGGSGLESLNFAISDITGEAKYVGTKPSDIPNASASLTEVPSKVGTLGIAWEWDELEMRRALRAGVSLSEKKAMAANRGMNQKLDKDAWFGDSTENIPGVLSAGNVALMNTDTATGAFTGLSADNLYDNIVNKIVNVIPDATEGSFECTTLVTTPKLQSLIMTKRFTGGSDKTVGRALLENTSITEIVGVPNRLEAVSTLSNKDVILGYARDPEVIELMTPGGMQSLPMRQVDMVFKTYLITDFAGAFMYQPKAFAALKDV